MQRKTKMYFLDEWNTRCHIDFMPLSICLSLCKHKFFGSSKTMLCWFKHLFFHQKTNPIFSAAIAVASWASKRMSIEHGLSNDNISSLDYRNKFRLHVVLVRIYQVWQQGQRCVMQVVYGITFHTSFQSPLRHNCCDSLTSFETS